MADNALHRLLAPTSLVHSALSGCCARDIPGGALGNPHGNPVGLQRFPSITSGPQRDTTSATCSDPYILACFRPLGY